MRPFVFLVTTWLAGPVLAQNDSAFVESNLLGVFYHELGHAIIDIEGVPIFGQEEDAADVFSIYMIHAVFDEEAAQDTAYDVAFGFWAEAETRIGEVPWWDEHGPDEQRFYNTVCVFYGGDPEARADLAAELDLPEDRAELCPFEFDQAEDAWGPVLDEMTARGGGDSLVVEGDEDSLTAKLVREEVDFLNETLSLAEPLIVTVESCGEANAFYDPETLTIVMCAEFEDHLRDLANR